MTITENQRKRIYQLLRDHDMVDSKESIVKQYTQGRTVHVSEMYIKEASELIVHLEYFSDTPKRQNVEQYESPASLEEGFKRNSNRFDYNDPKNSNESRMPMRKYIIHILGLLNFIDYTEDGPDYSRLNNFIINIGSNNPRKVILNKLSYYELHKVCIQVEQMYRHEQYRHSPTTREENILRAKRRFGIAS